VARTVSGSRSREKQDQQRIAVEMMLLREVGSDAG
jgi:hypothetical protein